MCIMDSRKDKIMTKEKYNLRADKNQKEFAINWLNGDKTNWDDFKAVSGILKVGKILNSGKSRQNKTILS